MLSVAQCSAIHEALVDMSDGGTSAKDSKPSSGKIPVDPVAQVSDRKLLSSEKRRLSSSDSHPFFNAR